MHNKDFEWMSNIPADECQKISSFCYAESAADRGVELTPDKEDFVLQLNGIKVCRKGLGRTIPVQNVS